jgi:hypothetical protein
LRTSAEQGHRTNEQHLFARQLPSATSQIISSSGTIVSFLATALPICFPMDHRVRVIRTGSHWRANGATALPQERTYARWPRVESGLVHQISIIRTKDNVRWPGRISAQYPRARKSGITRSRDALHLLAGNVSVVVNISPILRASCAPTEPKLLKRKGQHVSS